MARKISCPECGHLFSLRSDDEDRRITCPECEARFRPEAAEKASSKLSEDDDDCPRSRKNRDRDEESDQDKSQRRRERDGDADDDKPRRRRDRDDDDDEDERPRKKRRTVESESGGNNKAAATIGSVIGVLIVVGLIILRIYLRSERNSKRAADEQTVPLVHAPVPQIQPPAPVAFQRPRPDFNRPIVQANAPQMIAFEPQPLPRGPDLEPFAEAPKKDPPEKNHPQVKSLFGRWDCKLKDGITLSYTFFQDSGRFGLMKTEATGSSSWSGDFSVVKADAKGTKFTLKRDAPFKTTPPLFPDEHEDGEVEIEVVNATSIKIKSQKLPENKLGWRTFSKFQ